MHVFSDVLQQRRRRIKRLVLACYALAVTQLSANAESSPRVIETFIAAHARKLHGEEYRDARRVVSGDLNYDGQQDLAVQYTIEGMNGSNGYGFYLAVFLSRKEHYVYAASRQIGGKLLRDATLQAITDGNILFETRSYAPEDPSCCPSQLGHTAFTLHGNQLKEQ